jgi:hypothetical protein
MEKQEETILKFFNMTVERLESKIEVLQSTNINLTREVFELKSSLAFHSQAFDQKCVDIDNKLQRKTEEKTEKSAVEDKLAELEDRSRRNNLRFNGIMEEKGETWEESEGKVKEVLQKELGINGVIKIERAHRSGRVYRKDGSKNDTRTIVVKFLDFKDKETILTSFRQQKLWEKSIFINEDFSERTMQKRRELFKRAKELKERGIRARVVYNRLVTFENAEINGAS